MDIEKVKVLRQLQDKLNIFEDFIKAYYTEILRPGDLAVDGGANRGLHTWPMSELVGKGGQVMAFEPIPALNAALANKVRTQGLDQVLVLQKALSNKVGQSHFHWVKNGDGYSGIEPRSYPFEPEFEIIEVDLITLDLALKDSTKTWRFCKLDLEGGEFNAIRGAAEAIKKHSPFFIFECAFVNSAKFYGYTMEEFFQFFNDIGYVLYDLYGRPIAGINSVPPNLPHYILSVRKDSKDVEFIKGRAETIIDGVVARIAPNGP